MKRRNLLTCGLVAPLLAGCNTKPFFDLAWKEQVQLLDGPIILVTVKYTYQRLGSVLNFNRYTPSILRATEFSFTSDAPPVNFSKVFQRHRVNALQRIAGHWYLILEQRAGDAFIQTANGQEQLLGAAGDETGHKCFRLESGELVPVPVDFFSDALLTPNILMDMAEADVLAIFDSTIVTLEQKSQYLLRYPLDVTELRIKSRHDSIMNQK